MAALRPSLNWHLSCGSLLAFPAFSPHFPRPRLTHQVYAMWRAGMPAISRLLNVAGAKI